MAHRPAPDPRRKPAIPPTPRQALRRRVLAIVGAFALGGLVGWAGATQATTAPQTATARVAPVQPPTAAGIAPGISPPAWSPAGTTTAVHPAAPAAPAAGTPTVNTPRLFGDKAAVTVKHGGASRSPQMARLAQPGARHERTQPIPPPEQAGLQPFLTQPPSGFLRPEQDRIVADPQGHFLDDPAVRAVLMRMCAPQRHNPVASGSDPLCVMAARS